MKRLSPRILGFILCTALSLAQNRKVAKDFQSLDPQSNADVIVQFTQTPGAAQHKKVTDRGGAVNPPYLSSKPGPTLCLPAR